MATQDQVTALIRHHYTGNEEHFRAAVAQVIADENRKNHHEFARRLERILEREELARGKQPQARTMQVMPIQHGSGNALHARAPSARLSDIMLNEPQKRQVERVIAEHRAADKLFEFGLAPSRKILFAGPSGTGKTMTAGAIAAELELPFAVVQLDDVIKSHLGETQVALRGVFDAIRRCRGVYLFDEIDALAGARNGREDVSEMRRVVNSLLMMMDEDDSKSIMIGTTNLPELIDDAVVRRFDVVVPYDLPSSETARALLAATLVRMPCADFQPDDLDWTVVWKVLEIPPPATPLSHAQIVKACLRAMRTAVISNCKSVTLAMFIEGVQSVLGA